MVKQDKQEEEKKSKSLIVTFRVFQSIFFGLFALGLSLMIGDLSGAIKLPFSSFSITTTIFGLIGSIITGKLAEKCKDW